LEHNYPRISQVRKLDAARLPPGHQRRPHRVNANGCGDLGRNGGFLQGTMFIYILHMEDKNGIQNVIYILGIYYYVYLIIYIYTYIPTIINNHRDIIGV
jgi:hypothetical protein